MTEGRSRLAIFTIILTVIGVAVVIISQPVGLTIIFAANLSLAGYFIRLRLEALGAEQFALGSVFVWLGFFTSAFPLIAFAWDILEFGAQLFLFFLGVFLILFGFTTVLYDLNERFLNLLKNLKVRLRFLLLSIRRTLFRSIWTFLAILFFVLALLSFVLPVVNLFLPNIIGFHGGTALQFVILAVVSLLIEFRAILFVLLQSFFDFLQILSQALWRRLRNFPQLLKEFVQFIWQMLQRLFDFIWRLTRFLVTNIFISGFLGSIIIGVFGIVRGDQLLQAAALVLLLISLVNFLSTQQDYIGERVAGVQQFAYRRSFTLRNLIRQRHTGRCRNCGHEVRATSKHCSNCGAFIPDCLVCRTTVYQGEEILTCSNCEYLGHADHLERWLAIKPTCPNCKDDW